jgi:hypothetical protein
MKKPIFAIALVSLVAAGLGVWYLYRHWHSPRRTHFELKATMRDEDAPRPIVPSVGLQVNDAHAVTAGAGTPVWFTVGVNNAAAYNEISAAGEIADRLKRMSANAPGRAQLQADYRARLAPARIVLGDAAHPWAGAVQLLLAGAANTTLSFAPPLVGQSAPTVELDAHASVRVVFGAAALDAPPGDYAVVACLGATGTWQGRACSEPVKLTITPAPAHLALPDRVALAERGGRFALLAEDAKGLEENGRQLVAADPSSVMGHLYLGEAGFERGQFALALTEFGAARAAFRRRHPNAYEPPVFLNVRINQILNRPDGGK